MTKRFVNFVHDLIFFSSSIINLIAYAYKKNIFFFLPITPRERLIDCEKKKYWTQDIKHERPSLKCPYHQNFYFPIWSYISYNELLRKKCSIWIKSDFLWAIKKLKNPIFLRSTRPADHSIDRLRVVTYIQEHVAWLVSLVLIYLCKFSFVVHAKFSFPAFSMNY